MTGAAVGTHENPGLSQEMGQFQQVRGRSEGVHGQMVPQIRLQLLISRPRNEYRIISSLTKSPEKGDGLFGGPTLGAPGGAHHHHDAQTWTLNPSIQPGPENTAEFRISFLGKSLDREAIPPRGGYHTQAPQRI
jgi:hypothetical protein